MAHITSTLGDAEVNIENMLNKHKENIAYNIIDVNKKIDTNIIRQLSALDDVIFVRDLCF